MPGLAHPALHEPSTPEKLAQVEAAEPALRRLGFAELRVRHHGDVARVELPVDDLAAGRRADPLRAAIHEAVVVAGFRFVAVDLAGIQSGAFTLPLVRPGMADERADGGRGWRPPAELAAFAELDHDRAAARLPRGGATARARRPSRWRRSRPRCGSGGIRTLFTRADAAHARAVLAELPDAAITPTPGWSRGRREPPEPTGALVVVVAAGTSDLPVAREAALTARHLGRPAELVVDVGVAGLHRVLGHLKLLRRARAVVV